MAKFFTIPTTTVVGLMLFVVAARGWVTPSDLLTAQKTSNAGSTLPTWQSERTTNDANDLVADTSRGRAGLERGLHQTNPGGREIGTGTGEQSTPQAWRFVDDPELLVPIYAARGRARWCTAPQEFVFCNRWTPGDPGATQRSSDPTPLRYSKALRQAEYRKGRVVHLYLPQQHGSSNAGLAAPATFDRVSMPYDRPLHLRSASAWRMCSCGIW